MRQVVVLRDSGSLQVRPNIALLLEDARTLLARACIVAEVQEASARLRVNRKNGMSIEVELDDTMPIESLMLESGNLMPTYSCLLIVLNGRFDDSLLQTYLERGAINL